MSKPITRIPNFEAVFYHIVGQQSPVKAQPAVSAAIAEVFAAWGGMEMAMHLAYADLLGVRQKLASNIFMSIEAKGPRAAAIRALAKYRLNKEQSELFFTIMDLVDSVRGERDRLAHSVYGTIKLAPDPGSDTARDMPDHIVLAHPKDVSINKSTKRAVAYSAADIQAVAERINRYAFLLTQFSWAMRQKNNAQQNARFLLLSAEPCLAEALVHRKARSQRSG